MAKVEKRIVTIGVSTIEEAKQRLATAVRTRKFAGKGIYFLSMEHMWKTLAPKRWDILRAMVGQGPMSVREVSRRVGRDVKAVHGDVAALKLVGIVKTEGRKVVFPYDEIHLDVTIRPEVQAEAA